MRNRIGVRTYDDADGLRGVTGCFEHFELHLPQRQALPVGHHVDWKVGETGRCSTVGNHGSRLGRKLQVTAQEVGMEVGLDDAFDGKSEFSSVVHVL